MKKIIGLMLILIMLVPSLVDARGSSGGSRSSFSSSRSSTPSSTSNRSSMTTSSRPISQSKPSTSYRSSTTVISTPYYHGGGNYSNGFGSPFLSSLGGSVVGSIAGNMIYDSLKPTQHYGSVVNDGAIQYKEILDGSGQVVGYKPEGQLPQEPVEQDHTIAWMIFSLFVFFGLILIFKSVD